MMLWIPFLLACGDYSGGESGDECEACQSALSSCGI